MWSKKVSINTTVSKEQIWKLWSDVKNWKSWDEQVIESELNGAFELGRSGFLIPKGGPKTIFELIEVTKNKSFTSRSTLPLTKMDFIHTLNEENGRLTITHEVKISGILSFLFSRVIGEKLIQELPKALEELVHLAKKNNNE